MRWVGRTSLAVLAVFTGAFGPAAAADTRSVETGMMTWTEIRDAVAGGATTILIPTGGTEQNGPHMITGKHNIIVAETSRRIAQALGDALVAPVVAYTPEGDVAKRDGHMAYPGTISIRPEVFAAVVEDAARSFAAHGFKTIVFLGDSGPNQAPQRAVAAQLQREWAGRGLRVISVDAYYDPVAQTALLKAEGETDAAIGLHAGIRDTSELLAVAPDGVRTAKAAADRDGVSGDPTRASPERGARLIDIKVRAAVEAIKAARAATIASPEAPSGFIARLKRLVFGAPRA